MRTLLTMLVLGAATTLLSAQSKWVNPVANADNWILTNAPISQIQMEIPPLYPLVSEDKLIWEFQYEHNGLTEQVVVNLQDGMVYSVEYTTQYTNLDAVRAYLKDANYRQVGLVTDNAFETRRYYNADGSLLISLIASKDQNVLILAKEALIFPVPGVTTE